MIKYKKADFENNSKIQSNINIRVNDGNTGLDVFSYFISNNTHYPSIFKYVDENFIISNFESFLLELTYEHDIHHKVDPCIIYKSNEFRNLSSKSDLIESSLLSYDNENLTDTKLNRFLNTSEECIVYELLPNFIIEFLGVKFINTKTFNSLLDKETKLSKYEKVVDKIIVYYSPDTEYILKYIKQYINNNIIIDNDANKPSIGIITISDGEYCINYTNIENKIGSFEEPDLHYGDGFSIFLEKLIEKITSSSKGLVLLHGIPGSGKTYLLRYLIKVLFQKKRFLYMPSSMLEHISEPGFMSFLTDEASSNFYDKREIVIIAEDAETILSERDETMFTNGVANILNISDGLLNDILSIQIIATFNTNIGNIDKALLRQGRLLARKEFNSLPKEKAKQLIKYLNIDYEPESEMTLSDIYSLKNDTKCLVHDLKQTKKQKMGFIEN